MKIAAVASILWIGACSPQDLSFDVADSGGGDAPAVVTGCSTDSDCLPGLHCAVNSGQCVACFTNSQCTDPRKVCNVGPDVCVECLVDHDCANGTCDQTSSRCIPSCSNGGTCPDPFSCDTATGVCQGCQSGATFCESVREEPVCDTTTGYCVQCVADSQCGDFFCDRTIGRCVECINSQNCRSGSQCSPEDHVCIPFYPAVGDGGGGGLGFDADMHPL